jgi:tetratricopeptide (TPR) repeat protein
MISALVEYLAIFYQAGDLAQVEVIARSMLAAIPDDIVALQFLGLALYQLGRTDQAYRLFKRVALRQDRRDVADPTVCEHASDASYREATQAYSGLAEGWSRIAVVLTKFGFHKQAASALAAASASRGSPGAAPV